jgi:hypothetical protein
MRMGWRQALEGNEPRMLPMVQKRVFLQHWPKQYLYLLAWPARVFEWSGLVYASIISLLLVALKG